MLEERHMAGLYLCTISVLKGKTADVCIPDREDMVITDVPFIEKVPGNLQVNDLVFAIFNERGGRIERGCILGRKAGD